jgi:hypothetical protein
MANLYVRQLPLSRFDWNKERGVLSACASDFGPLRDGMWWVGRLYDDAADMGIAIKSERTGVIERFVLSDEEERGGELLAWRFVPVNPQKSRVSSVIVFND